jgi:hypothetical protein
MSLNERRIQKQKQQQQRSQQITSSMSMQNYNNPIDEQLPRSTSSASAHPGNNSFKSQGHGRSPHQQNPTNNNFYRQTTVTPRILNSSHNEDQHAIQSSSAYFGSGSNVGRGRPMTGDR